MPRIKLTDAFVRAAKPLPSSKPKQSSNSGKLALTEYADTSEKGLCLRVTPTGVKSWTYRYRLNSGDQRRLSLGKLIDVSLADARGRVVAYRANVATGGDPVLAAKQARAHAKQSIDSETVKAVGEWYFKACAKGNHRGGSKRPKKSETIAREIFYFERRILPEFGSRKLSTITRAEIRLFIETLESELSLGAAQWGRNILNAIYEFARRNEIVDKNPCEYVTVASHAPRERVLDNSELKTIWENLTPPIEIAGAAISSNVAYSILLGMVTLQRRGEITGMCLSELDFDLRLWTLPGSRTKNNKAHIVPLSDLAIELIRAAVAHHNVKASLCFPRHAVLANGQSLQWQ